MRGLVTALCLGLLYTTAVHGQVVIDIDRTVDRRTPIAVPVFSASPGHEALGEELAAIVRADLEFTGLFSILPEHRYPSGFTRFTDDAGSIQFTDWANAGVEFLVYAHVRVEDGRIAAECRLFDVIGGQQVVGELLQAGHEWFRLVAHRFADEIVYFLTGNRGCATSRILFSARMGDAKEIFVADYDGANATRITQHNSISILPEFSPDGTKMAYLSFREGFPFLYIHDLVSGESRTFSKRVGLNAAPAWSPDGQRIAYVLSIDGRNEIYMKNADGTGERRLTYERTIDMSPTFDPSGNQIAFVSERGGGPQIYVMNADGSNPRRLSFQGGNSYDPNWSPDGRMIAYVVSRQIWVMNADGSNPRQLTTAGTNESPVWSPDSRHVMFVSNRTGTTQLWTVRIEDGYQQQVPRLNLPCEGPSWGPRRE